MGRDAIDPITTLDPRYVHARKKLEDPNEQIRTSDMLLLLGYSQPKIFRMAKDPESSLRTGKDPFGAYVWTVNAVREYLGLPPL